MIQYLNCLLDILCGICTVQIQPRKNVLDHAEYTAPTLQHELRPIDQESVATEISTSRRGNRCSVRSVICLAKAPLMLLPCRSTSKTPLPTSPRTRSPMTARDLRGRRRRGKYIKTEGQQWRARSSPLLQNDNDSARLRQARQTVLFFIMGT